MRAYASAFPIGGADMAGLPTDYAHEVLKDRPVRYFRLKDRSGTVAWDSSGNHAHGTYGGTYQLRQRGFVLGGGSTKFDAATGSINANGHVLANLTTTFQAGCAVEFFFNAATSQPDAIATLIGQVEYFANTPASFPLSVRWNSNSTLTFSMSRGDDFAHDLVLTVPGLSPATDYLVLANYRPNGLCELIVNGVVAASGAFSGTISSTTIPWRIGASTELGGGAGASGFDGLIAEAAIYPHPVPAQRAAAHYAASGRR
jgi:hypothetical protein